MSHAEAVLSSASKMREADRALETRTEQDVKGTRGVRRKGGRRVGN
jgi:hypothetical protein